MKSNHQEAMEELHLLNNLPYRTENEEIYRLQVLESLYYEAALLGIKPVKETSELDSIRKNALDRKASIVKQLHAVNNG